MCEPPTTIVMTGDSITDAGRNRETWPGDPLRLGSGYVALVDAMVRAVHPGWDFVVHNAGVSGDRVTDLAARFQTDVLGLEPDWISICIGINDVWRGFQAPAFREQVDLDQYERTLGDLTERSLRKTGQVLLMAPFFLEPNRREPMRQRMDQYGQAMRRVAEGSGAIFVDTQAAFDQYLSSAHPFTLAGDRVHPNLTGHWILAKALIEASGLLRTPLTTDARATADARR